MANSLQMNKSVPIVGLADFQYTVQSSEAGLVTIECKAQIPGCVDVQSQQQSGVSIEIKKNSTSLVVVGGSATNPTPSQGSIAASTSTSVAANDVIHVILTSSNAIDSVPNNVKGVVNIYQGIGD